MADVEIKRKTRWRLSHCFSQSDDFVLTTNMIIEQELSYNKFTGVIEIKWKLDHPSQKLMKLIKEIRLIEQQYYDYDSGNFRGCWMYVVNEIKFSKFFNYELIKIYAERRSNTGSVFKMPPPYENGGFDYSVYDPWNRGIE
jgi:hypothetical protein